MLRQLSISVPSYFYKSKASIYDHPFKIAKFKQEGKVLMRLIKSINENVPKNLQTNIYLIPGITKEFISMKKLENIIVNEVRGFIKKINIKPNIKIILLSDEVLKSLLKIKRTNIPISNIFYGNIRNLQLITQIIFDEKYQLNLDDDEVVVNQKFFSNINKIVKNISKKRSIIGTGGFYVDKKLNPNIQNSSKMPTGINILKGKEFIMQASIEKNIKLDRDGVSSMIFGGLNLMKIEAAENVCYDPELPRGEDIDFVINGMFKNLYFNVSKNFIIMHLPPGNYIGSHFASNESKMAKDCKRFIYEKMKINRFLKIFKFNKNKFHEALNPYPEYFINQTLSDLKRYGVSYIKDKELDRYIIKEAPVAIDRFKKIFIEWPVFISRVRDASKKIQGKYVIIN